MEEEELKGSTSRQAAGQLQATERDAIYAPPMENFDANAQFIGEADGTKVYGLPGPDGWQLIVVPSGLAHRRLISPGQEPSIDEAVRREIPVSLQAPVWAWIDQQGDLPG